MMKRSNVILVWGIGTGLATVAFSQIISATGHEESGVKYFNYLILFLGLFIGTMKVRDKANGGYISYGQGFKVGFLITLIIAGISVIAFIIDMQIHPGLIDKIREHAQDRLVNKGSTNSQVYSGTESLNMMGNPFMLCVSILCGGLFIGTIMSLITAGLCTKKSHFMRMMHQFTIILLEFK